MSKEKAEKLYEMYSLVGELFFQYPNSIDEVFMFLIDAKEFYKSVKEYETQKSIEQEYVVEDSHE